MRLVSWNLHLTHYIAIRVGSGVEQQVEPVQMARIGSASPTTLTHESRTD